MKIIVISPHPDDETLGCGGTILKHINSQDSVIWIIVTSIFTEQGYTLAQIRKRKKEISQVSSTYGFYKTYLLDFPTTKLTEIGECRIINAIENIFNKEQPDVIYLPNRSDAHSDHKMVFDASMACSKSFRKPSIKKILMYECLSETEFAPSLFEKVFIPNYFIDISQYFMKKIEIMHIYTSELNEHPFPRSIKNIEALATLRGAQSGVFYAEAFQLIKFIDK